VRIPLLLFSFFLIFLSCSSQPIRPGVPPHLQDVDPLIILEQANEVNRITLDREVVYQDSLLLDNIPGIAIGSRGSLFIAGEAWERMHIYKFDPRGNRLDTYGGYGSSEGEFYRIDGIQMYNNDLFVFDGELGRITRLDAESGVTRRIYNFRPDSARFEGRFTNRDVTPVHVYDENRFLVRISENSNPAFYPDRKLVYAIMNAKGEILADSVLVQNDMAYLVGDYAGRPAAFSLDRPEKSLLDIGIHGLAASAWTGEFYIEIYNPDFTFSKAYFNKYERAQLDKDNVVKREFSHNDQLLRIRQTADYPETWPALYSLLSDDRERIWVSAITSNEDEFMWWVIDQNGNYARFVWPSDREIAHVQDGYVYTIERDPAGFKDVVRYRITGFE
jgi:hypothetical protein